MESPLQSGYNVPTPFRTNSSLVASELRSSRALSDSISLEEFTIDLEHVRLEDVALLMSSANRIFRCWNERSRHNHVLHIGVARASFWFLSIGIVDAGKSIWNYRSHGEGQSICDCFVNLIWFARGSKNSKEWLAENHWRGLLNLKAFPILPYLHFEVARQKFESACHLQLFAIPPLKML